MHIEIEPVYAMATLFLLIVLANVISAVRQSRDNESREGSQEQDEEANQKKDKQSKLLNAADSSQVNKKPTLEQSIEPTLGTQVKPDAARDFMSAIRNLGVTPVRWSELHSVELLRSVAEGVNPVTKKAFHKMDDLKSHLVFAMRALENDLGTALHGPGGVEPGRNGLHSFVMLKSVSEGVNPITGTPFTRFAELKAYVTFAILAFEKDLGVCESSRVSPPQAPRPRVNDPVQKRSSQRNSADNGTRQMAFANPIEDPTFPPN